MKQSDEAVFPEQEMKFCSEE